MPNMEELISRISRKKSEEKEDEIWLTKLDFDYAYGQINLDDETQNLCIFTITGGEFTGYYRVSKGFDGLADIPTIIQERIDKTIEFKHPASAQTDILRKLFKKQNEWKWTQDHTEAFNNLKKLITQLPCLAHYNTDNENIPTTDASTKGLGATLWQK